MALLRVMDLSVEVDGKKVLKNVNLSIGVGERILLLGPNGSGKSSLIQTIIGNPKYKVVRGKIFFNNEDITALSPEKRVSKGISAAFQIPPKIKGVTFQELIKLVISKSGRGFEKLEEVINEMGVNHLLKRDLNVGFSGGEMKKAELFLLFVKKPKLALIDEPDSGVDVENISLIGKMLRKLLNLDGKRRKNSAIVVTHTGYIADYIEANRAYVMLKGTVKCYGNPEIILKNIRKKGFEECVKCEYYKC